MHPTLTALIDFERQRTGIPVFWRRRQRRDDGGFRPAIQFQGPTSAYPDRVMIPQDGNLFDVTVATGAINGGKEIGVKHNDEYYKLATVDGRYINFICDIEALFENPPDGFLPHKFFEEVAKEAVPAAREFIEAYKHDEEAKKYREWNMAGFEEQLSRWRANMRDNEFELDRAHSTIVNLIRKNRDLKDQLEAAGKLTRTKREELSKAEFQRVLKMMPAPIRTVEIQSGELRLEIDSLSVEHDGVDYDLGALQVKIGSDRVRIFSLDGNSYAHPHVGDDGIVCWGSIGTEVAKLLGDREHAALVAVIVEFLQSYNEEDAYRRIEHWGDEPFDED